MFAKVFSQIFDSSIAEDHSVRHVFMDLLVLADSDGVIDMTLPAIARRTNVPIEIVKDAIAALSAADPASRTKEHEGRRLLPLAEGRDWGWRIVNYLHYRQLQTEESRRDYFREYRRKSRVANVAVQPVHSGSQEFTNAEGEEDEEAEEPPLSDEECEEADAVARRPLAITSFEDFWQAYPKKVGKGAAEIAWKKQRVSAKLPEILTAIRAAKLSMEWTKESGQFIPNPATWINQRRWEDQLTPSRGSAPSEDVDPAGWREWLKEQKRDYMPYRFAIPPFLKDDFRKSRT